jgi:hypothetical protein
VMSIKNFSIINRLQRYTYINLCNTSMKSKHELSSRGILTYNSSARTIEDMAC